MIILSIHIFPFELVRYKRIAKKLKDCLGYVNTDNILLHTTLNTNESILKKNTHSITSLKKEFSETTEMIPCKTTLSIVNERNFLGVNEHRRNTLSLSSDDDYIIYLDSDLFFNETILAHHIQAINTLSHKHKYFITSPNTIKLWDNTWDILTHPKYASETNDFYLNANYESIVGQNYGKVALKKINKFKWGGGWFNCISASLLRMIGIPSSFKGYGPDDTFVMECCKVLKSNKIDVCQYILQNVVVCEDVPLNKNKCMFKENTPNFREICNSFFKSELSKFKSKL